jgi:alpha-glucuronidase
MKALWIAVISPALLTMACGSGADKPGPSQGGAGGISSSTGGSSGSPGGAGGSTATATGGSGGGGLAGSRTGGSSSGGAGGAAGSTADSATGGAPAGGAAGTGRGGAGGTVGGAGGGLGGSTGTGRGGAGGGTSAGGTSGAGGTDSYPTLTTPPADEDGSQLWLRYPKVSLPSRLTEYQAALTHVVKAGTSDTLQIAQAELVKGLSGLTGKTLTVADAPTGDGAVVLGTPESSTLVKALALAALASVGTEGYVVQAADVGGSKAIVVAGNTDVGVLRGSFALLRHLQSHRTVQGLALSGAPKIKRRILDHWDNMDGSIERGYAGKSIWNWSSLPATISQRYKDYARANASIGINGAVLNNVNSNAQILTSTNLDKVAALATAFRPYGIAVYLTARFSAPIEIGSLSTADPLNADVKKWWASKADEIYKKIPDFGGFLVKANSEGQPGPQDYNRTHADGAKTLSDALAPHNGVVMWRAFVYKDDGSDRIGQAYDEFHPLDGKFGSNAMLQVKNGPLDFQPREPFSPLFGSMPNTPVALELQITKEYLGEDTHLVYLGPLYEEVLKSDTYAKGQGSTVARVIDGTVHGYTSTAIAGVANVGSDTNWTGSHFNQANWYVFGRMAWDPDATAADVADEWIRQTLSNDPAVITPVTSIMMASRQNLVNYMEPLGLVHIMGTDHHYGPGPWINDLSQANWNPFYFHKADATGIGFDRTSKGSNAVAQYQTTVRDKFASRATVPDEFLLFFQRVGWDEKLTSSGRSLWEELVYRYSAGVDAVSTMRDTWKTVSGQIDAKRFKDVSDFLQTQHYEARWWRDACLQYFASVSKHSIPSGYAAPAHDLQWYKDLKSKCPADATKPRCPDVYTGTPSPAITK